MNSRVKKFLSYYKPYLGLFYADIACAIVASAITLALPLCIRYITQNLVEPGTPHALSQIYTMGAVMLGLVLLNTACHVFISYKGHMMGAKMEADMRTELFEHYQKLSFNFYKDENCLKKE